VVQTGVVWLASRADGFEADSLTALNRLDIPAERLDPDVLGARYPQMTLDGVECGERWRWSRGHSRTRVANSASVGLA
jgi:hypothetical protein